MSHQERFKELCDVLPNESTQSLFREIGEKSLSSWNNHSFDMMRIFSKSSFSSMKRDPYVWGTFINTPLSWLFHMNDPDFRVEIGRLDLQKIDEPDRLQIVKFMISNS